MLHVPVLLQQVIDGLDVKPGETVLDATLGSGGHAETILQKYGDTIRYIGLDRDLDALERTKVRVGDKVIAFEANFREMEDVLRAHDIQSVDKILFDLGWSSDQFELSGRGFSFQKDEPLLMTFEKDSKGTTAREAVNVWKEESLADIIYGFGEERYARRIARAIVAARESAPIETTGQLVEIIRKATPSLYHHRKIHFATKTFQALRIAVNDEYGALKQGLAGAWNILNPNGRIAVISFHSGEDRIVKTFFKTLEKEGKGTLIYKKPLIASPEESSKNRRARSAKLRIIKKS
jgi:16S rRNA (cytosine1402-N4)-methyltransferase